MKISATFEVDEEILKEMEDGNIEDAFAWCVQSGVCLESYEIISE